MKVSFKFQTIKSDIFGFIYRPYADVIVYGKHGKPRKITMVVDTGADYTILPRREAALLGIDLNQDCTMHTTYGVGGPQTVYLYKNLLVVLGNKKIKIPVEDFWILTVFHRFLGDTNLWSFLRLVFTNDLLVSACK